jgi:hypothetical protein
MTEAMHPAHVLCPSDRSLAPFTPEKAKKADRMGRMELRESKRGGTHGQMGCS